MNVSSSAPVSSQLAAVSAEVGAQKLANDKAKFEGLSALKLIQSVPQPNDRVGNNINIAV